MSAVLDAGVAAAAPATSARARWSQATIFIVLLLAVFTGKQIFSVAAFYPFSGHDELAHYSYIRTLATEARLPVLPDLQEWRGELSGGQPPPTDELPGELYTYCRFALDWFCEPENVRWRENPPRIVTVPGYGYYPSGYQYVANHPPLYYALMSPVYLLSRGASVEVQQYLLRLAAIPFGLLTVYAAFRTVRLLFPNDWFMLVTVPAFVAFQPQISYEAAMVNNDIVAIALFSLLIWGIVAGMKIRLSGAPVSPDGRRSRGRLAGQEHHGHHCARDCAGHALDAWHLGLAPCDHARPPGGCPSHDHGGALVSLPVPHLR